jgi:hypothetical protein
MWEPGPLATLWASTACNKDIFTLFYLSICLSICLWLYSPLLGLGCILNFLIFTPSVRILGQGISPSQDHYLYTGQHKHRINAHNTDIRALTGIRTHDPSVQAGEDGSCLRPRGHCDWRYRDHQS